MANGTGTAGSNVTNVQVACSNLPPTTYTIGGTFWTHRHRASLAEQWRQQPADQRKRLLQIHRSSRQRCGLQSRGPNSAHRPELHGGQRDRHGQRQCDQYPGRMLDLPPTTYTIGGTVSGLTGPGWSCRTMAATTCRSAPMAPSPFRISVARGATYSVTVLTQPKGQNCNVANGTGTAGSNVTNVQVACSNIPPTTYTIGGTVSGLTGTGLVLQNNGGNNLPISANGSFKFTAAVASGAAYKVAVLSQPTGQNCTVANGTGTANGNVTNIQVACSNLPPTTYTIGGTVSGLTGTGWSCRTMAATTCRSAQTAPSPSQHSCQRRGLQRHGPHSAHRPEVHW